MARLPHPVVVTVTAAVLVAVVGTPAGVGYAAYRQDRARLGVLPRGATVGSVDVSGMSRPRAVAAVRLVVERDFDRAVLLRVGSRLYETTQRRLGVADDVPAAVDEAFRSSTSGSWLHRAWGRLTGKSTPPTVAVAVTPPSLPAMRAIVAHAVRDAAVAPVDATVHLHNGFLVFTDSTPGRRLDPAVALAALRASVRDGRLRPVPLASVAPAVGGSAFDTVVVVHTGENRLYVYKHHQIVASFPVATGSPDFPTPSGRWHVVVKRYLPTWVNPHPDVGWGKLEPPTIPPGPNNPLGTRAMNLSAPNIRIHGTPSANSIGWSASHGCIRMTIHDVEALYPMVPTGTTVFITQVGPFKLPPPSAHVSVASIAEGG